MNTGTGNFDIKGDYTISSGNVHFVVLGLAARDFIINEGSNIRFNGDVMESTLDISATYRTKASLSTLIADTTSINNKRLVECGIRVTDKLKNPRLSFSINIPDLDPMIKAKVENALSTEDKVQKQFIYLLISNSFLPDEQSGIVNNTSNLYASVGDLMLNQLNNIFQKLNIPLDLGLNYQQNTRGDNIFDVAVSTQLFNNRVIVNGNIGNRQYRTGNSNSDVVGD
ncbi:MAG: translocation/assembly module TamB, partial [Bacteroidales bacterium]|nr:translocation/assembly module TamB [Bacteroidales bacterium]